MITPLGIAGFCLLAATTQRRDDPARACRPFDRRRDGTVISEGAVVLVIEAEDVALARGATPLAEIAGFGASADAYRPTDTPPSGEGIAKCMAAAIADARLSPESIDYVNAHGTATPQNDVSETCAIKAVFGEKAPPVSSTKSMTGHLIGASGAVEAIVCIKTILDGCLQPTISA